MKITIFGDSITNGRGMDEGQQSNVLQRLIEAKRPDVQVRLYGMNGDDSYGALHRIKYVMEENADLNFIFFGANDASPYHLIRPDEFQTNLSKMIALLGSEKVVLISPPYYNDQEPMHYSSLSEVQLFRQAAKELALQKQIPFIDIFDIITKQPNPNRLLRPDGLHFTLEAYELLAEAIVEKIDQKNRENA
ncbi:MAG: GDSL-type esterase/lipase family protein [Streptococcaceae bacterium]|nr:GDSL-type esterase/lipase family protein [Streptococcaceae bacterium]